MSFPECVRTIADVPKFFEHDRKTPRVPPVDLFGQNEDFVGLPFLGFYYSCILCLIILKIAVSMFLKARNRLVFQDDQTPG